MTTATHATKLNFSYVKIITKIILYAALLCGAISLYSFLFARIVGGGVALVPPSYTASMGSYTPPKRFSLLGSLKSVGRKISDGTKSLLWRRKQIAVMSMTPTPAYSSDQERRVQRILSTLTADESLCEDAQLTNWRVDEELILRYLDSADWGDNYHGKTFEDTIREAIQWRKQFGVHLINSSEVYPVLSTGVAYVRSYDQHQRPVIYIRINRLEDRVTEEVYVKSIVYTLERANYMSETSGAGTFVTVMDLQGSPWISTNHMNPVLALLNILKNIYPRRLGAIYIVNTGIGFRSFWNIIKRVLSGKTLKKIRVLTSKEAQSTLRDSIGDEYLEAEFGGKVSSEFDIRTYLSEFDLRHIYVIDDDTSRDL